MKKVFFNLKISNEAMFKKEEAVSKVIWSSWAPTRDPVSKWMMGFRLKAGMTFQSYSTFETASSCTDHSEILDCNYRLDHQPATYHLTAD